MCASENNGVCWSTIFSVCFGCLAAVVILMRLMRGFVYDFLIVQMTTRFYAAVLAKLPTGTSVLDIGIGTATSLVRNGEVVKQKKLRFTGIDYDASYVKRAVDQVEKAGLSDLVQVHCRSVYDNLKDL